MSEPTTPLVPASPAAAAWTLYEPGELLCELPDVQPRLASWDAKTSRAQQELQAYLDAVATQVGPYLGDHTDLYLEMVIDVRARERLHKEYDLENYLYPLINRLGHQRFLLARARKYVAVDAPPTVPYDERPRASIRIGRARACTDAPNAGWQHVTVAMGPGSEQPEWKKELQARIASQAKADHKAQGPFALQLVWGAAPTRNWSNLWKPTGDSLGPLLGTLHKARPYSPNDDRIVDLRLHRNDVAALGNHLHIGLWWRDQEDPQAVYGKPVAGDDEWVARKRFHQSWYRHHVLRADCAPTPGHGNYLSESDAWEGRNFLTPAIAQVARERFPPKPGAAGKNRLYGNMLSSQPMCFNLFGQLRDNPDLARKLVSSLIPDYPVDEVIEIALEVSNLHEVLKDNTAFDAMIRYRSGQERRFVGIETKYSEPFSAKKGAGTKARYRYWFDHADRWWRPDTYDKLLGANYQQLWRNHMLALALSASDPDYGIGELIVLYAPDDPKMAAALSEYCQTLAEHTPPPRAIPLDTLIADWLALDIDAVTRTWLNAFSERYLDFNASEAEWKRYRNK
ncbi:hypothetical protein [Candidatus Chloroploca sp. Khr17]|uniref:PGN_0703 family putative restriction endonuclease n=1 Tax=Candidatus Chloroploca sp. Khr17 TaxID=2496869 RepID=UPI00101D4B8B|nr:hypothetical protein [Candidatus Chloroploca sp. Khr17]